MVPPQHEMEKILRFDLSKEYLLSSDRLIIRFYDFPVSVDELARPITLGSFEFNFGLNIERREVKTQSIQCVSSDESILNPNAFSKQLQKLTPGLDSCVQTVPMNKRVEFTILAFGNKARVSVPLIGARSVSNMVSECFAKSLRPVESAKTRGVVAIRCGVRGGCAENCE
jgi:hypothetical protein